MEQRPSLTLNKNRIDLAINGDLVPQEVSNVVYGSKNDELKRDAVNLLKMQHKSHQKTQQLERDLDSILNEI